jgi:hypothetical protein
MMNDLLQHYLVDVEFSDVSGAEQLEMLQLRDKLFKVEAMLSPVEKKALAEADRRLLEQAVDFHAALAPFVDFEERRQAKHIPATHWWWYLDVLAKLPRSRPTQKRDFVTA